MSRSVSDLAVRDIIPGAMAMGMGIPITATTGPIHITASRIVRTDIARTTGITAEEFITHVTVIGVKLGKVIFLSWWASAHQLTCFLDQESALPPLLCRSSARRVGCIRDRRLKLSLESLF